MTLLWVKNGKRRGRLLPYAYFEQFGRKETLDYWTFFSRAKTLFFVTFGFGLSCL